MWSQNTVEIPTFSEQVQVVEIPEVQVVVQRAVQQIVDVLEPQIKEIEDEWLAVELVPVPQIGRL